MSLEKLEALIQTSPYPWWEWEPKTDRLVFSPFKVTKLGYPGARFLGKGYGAFMALVHPDDADRAMASMRRLLYEGVDLYQIDYRIRDAPGVYHWFMDRGFVTARDEAEKPRPFEAL